MSTGQLEPSTDVAAAGWIAPRLSGRTGSVTGTVPDGYPAYARLFHPATDEYDNAVCWAQVADRTGRLAHPTMQWHKLIDSADYLNPSSPLWPGDNPEQGNLDPAGLAALCRVLRRHTGSAETCWFCLWDGWGWVHGGSAVQVVLASNDPDDSAEPAPAFSPPPAFGAEQLDGPRVRHPGREYLLFAGPLVAARTLGDQVTGDWFIPQSPNLFWPADRAWCVATEIDFDSTLIAGSVALIEELCADEELEVLPVGPGDLLTVDGDQLNPVPGR